MRVHTLGPIHSFHVYLIHESIVLTLGGQDRLSGSSASLSTWLFGPPDLMTWWISQNSAYGGHLQLYNHLMTRGQALLL